MCLSNSAFQSGRGTCGHGGAAARGGFEPRRPRDACFRSIRDLRHRPCEVEAGRNNCGRSIGIERSTAFEASVGECTGGIDGSGKSCTAMEPRPAPPSKNCLVRSASGSSLDRQDLITDEAERRPKPNPTRFESSWQMQHVIGCAFRHLGASFRRRCKTMP